MQPLAVPGAASASLEAAPAERANARLLLFIVLLLVLVSLGYLVAGARGLTRMFRGAALRLWLAVLAVPGHLRTVWSYRPVRIAFPIMAALFFSPPAAVIYHVYFDRSGLPDLAPFLGSSLPPRARSSTPGARS